MDRNNLRPLNVLLNALGALLGITLMLLGCGEKRPVTDIDLVIATFTAQPSEGPAPLEVIFSYSLNDVDKRECIFDPGDGSDAQEVDCGALGGTSSHTYTAEGTFTASLKLFDRAVNSVTDTKTVEIKVSSAQVPRIDTFEAKGKGDKQVAFTWRFTGIADAEEMPVCTLEPGDDRGAQEVDCGTPTAEDAQVIEGKAEFAYSEPGAFTATLSVSYPSLGVSDSAQTEVDVTEAPVYTLSVGKFGDGSGTVTSDPDGIACDPACAADSADYPEGTVVALSATPEEGSVFTLWSGDCDGSTPVITVTMTADLVCDATFATNETLYLIARDFLNLGGIEGFDLAFSSPGNGSSFVPQQADSATELVAIEFDTGDAHHIDFSDPAESFVVDTAPNFCPGARSLTFYTNEFAGPDVEATFVAFSTEHREQCSGGIPFGMTSAADLGSAPGGAADVPGTFKYAWADFEGNIAGNGLRIQDASSAGDNGFVPLSGSERSCPFSVAIPDDQVAYVVGREGAAGTSTESCDDWRVLWIVDLVNREVETTVDLGIKPRDLALSIDGGTAYVADFEEDKIYVVDLAAAAVSHTIETGDGPTDVALSADGGFLFVTNWNANKLQLFDLTDERLLTEVDSGGLRPVKVALAPDGRTVIVAHFGDETGGGLGFFEFNAPD